MKNIVIGTAGHVDHGKTCLIKTLTGIDTDRLKEEQKRGITIENGFADFVLGEYDISVIDVPGHEKFIKNMLAGIGGIDMVLLVIGLDEGVMPQTVEHLQILTMLGIEKGIIVFTKSDLVQDEEWRELVKDDTASLVSGTFLENAPMVEVSAYTGFNIEELKRLILSNIEDKGLRQTEPELFRLPIDRVFTIDGFGTVITGTLLEGQVSSGEEVMVYPQGRKVKIRNLQVHNHTVQTAYAGQRTAVNLNGVKKEELERGQVLARPTGLTPSMMLDVRLELSETVEREVLNGSRVHIYCGASQVIGKVVLLDRDALFPGEQCYAQLRLEEEIAVRRSDRFIIRFYSPVITVGGGKVLEANPDKHKRFREDILERLRIKDVGSDKEIMALLVKEEGLGAPSDEELFCKICLQYHIGQYILNELKEEGVLIQMPGRRWIHKEAFLKVVSESVEILENYHSKNKLSLGMAKEEFKSRLMKNMHLQDGKVAEELFSLMEKDSVIKCAGQTVSLKDFSIEYSPELEQMRQRMIEIYRDKPFEMPTIEEALEAEADKVNGKHIIEALAVEGFLLRLDYQYYIASDAFREAVKKTRRIAEENDGKFTLAQFRDVIGTSRKYALVILDHLDREKITQKVEDVRIFLDAGGEYGI